MHAIRSRFTAALALAVCALALPTIAAHAADGRPAMFADMSFDEALSTAQRERRPLLVKATAEWCGPCKTMDRVTWSDERVASWVGERALAIQVDIDHAGSFARTYRIHTIPTTMVFEGGQEIARATGFMGADQMLDWLPGAMHAQAEAPDSSQKQVTEITPDTAGADDQADDGEPDYYGPPDMIGDADLSDYTTRAGLVQQARHLIEQADFENALALCTQLWNRLNGGEYTMQAERDVVLTGSMEALANAYKPAEIEFRAMRDEIGERLSNGKGSQTDLNDWLVLNIRVLNEPGPVLDWASRIEKRNRGPRTLQEYAMLITKPLVVADRWETLGRMAHDPARQERNFVTMMGFMQEPEYAASMMEMARAEFSIDHAGLLALGDDAAAWRMAKAATNVGEAIDADGITAEAVNLGDHAQADMMRMQLVATALRAGEARPNHRALLDTVREVKAFTPEPGAAEIRLDDLRATLEAALEADTKPARRSSGG